MKMYSHPRKIGLYLLGKKGLCVLEALIREFSPSHIAFVEYALDSGVDNDYGEDVAEVCNANFIPCWERGSNGIESCEAVMYRFAVGWRWMIYEKNIRLIVFHDSVLPKYRGFSPLVNMLIDGASTLGVTALYAHDDYDSGLIIDQRTLDIAYPLKVASAIESIIPLYIELAIEISKKIVDGSEIDGAPQNDEAASYSPWRDQLDYFIDWSWSSEKLVRFVDALGTPYEGAKTRLEGKTVVVLEAATCEGYDNVEGRRQHIGKVIAFHSGNPIVICGQGALKLKLIVSESTKVKVTNIPMRTRFS